jgi:hypothetical protein
MSDSWPFDKYGIWAVDISLASWPRKEYMKSLGEYVLTNDTLNRARRTARWSSNCFVTAKFLGEATETPSIPSQKDLKRWGMENALATAHIQRAGFDFSVSRSTISWIAI